MTITTLILIVVIVALPGFWTGAEVGTAVGSPLGIRESQDYVLQMSWWQAASWGLAGGLAAGVLALMTAVTAAHFQWPWKPGEFGPRLFVFCGTVLLGALVATAMHSQMNGAWPAFVIGAGAPATVRGLLSGVEVDAKLPSDPPQACWKKGQLAALKAKPTREEEVNESAG